MGLRGISCDSVYDHPMFMYCCIMLSASVVALYETMLYDSVGC